MKKLLLNIAVWKAQMGLQIEKRRFRKACKMADDFHKGDNKTYYVTKSSAWLPVSSVGHNYVFGNREFKRMKKLGYFDKKLTIPELALKGAVNYIATSDPSQRRLYEHTRGSK